MITDHPFPDAFAILPSETYVFNQAADSNELGLRIVGRKHLVNGIEVLATNIGLLAFDFRRSVFGGFRRLEYMGEGEVPEAVMDNADAIITLQVKRLRMAVFVTACIYGAYAKRNHRSLTEPLFPGLDEIYNWAELPGHQLGLPQFETDRLTARLAPRKAVLRKRQLGSYSISAEDLAEGLALADRLLTAIRHYAVADPVAMLVMTYQAMILHGRQHASASIALAAVVTEAAVEELMFACGLVSGFVVRLSKVFLDGKAASAPISRSQLKKLGFAGMVAELKRGGIINPHLAQRIETLRKARNALMHESQDAAPRESGEALTVVRDILWLCTDEADFELMVAWAYRY